MVNHYASQGLEYVRLESVETIITTPANAGCFGIGATPASSVPTIVLLCRLRDEVLLQSVIGNAFVKTYYIVSPTIASKSKGARLCSLLLET
jgi:hypothetical protein